MSLTISHEDRIRQIVRHLKKTVQPDPNVKVPAWFAALLDAAALAISDQDARYADAMNRLEERTRASENSELVMEIARGRA